jgi:hypothetical protein
VSSKVAAARPPSPPPKPPEPPRPPPVVDDLRALFAKFKRPDPIVVQTGAATVRVPGPALDQMDAALAAEQGSLTLPDEVMVGNVKVPYYAAWKAETDHGKRMGLAPWAQQQAARYRVPIEDLHAAVAADWTRQGQQRDAHIAQLRDDFTQRHGVTLQEVHAALAKLRQAHEHRVIAELARRYRIANPKLTSWGPAAGSLGITGTIAGQRVLLYQGKIYRGSERPPDYFTKCLPPDARIATPRGDIPLARLAPGAPVWTLDRRGARVVRPIVAIRSVPVTTYHAVVQVTLADGRQLRASALHPAADHRQIVGDWRVGDRVDGADVVDIVTIDYEHAATHDLLPAGDTGAYWADGVVLGSTLDELR